MTFKEKAEYSRQSQLTLSTSPGHTHAENDAEEQQHGGGPQGRVGTGGPAGLLELQCAPGAVIGVSEFKFTALRLLYCGHLVNIKVQRVWRYFSNPINDFTTISNFISREELLQLSLSTVLDWLQR